MTSGHTITTQPSNVHVEIAIDGTTVGVTDRPVLLEETGLPTRYYLPREDVRMDLLHPTDTKTTCPFKGQASYWSVVIEDRTYTNAVWGYADPIPQAEGIAGLVCFTDEQAKVTVGDTP